MTERFHGLGRAGRPNREAAKVLDDKAGRDYIRGCRTFRESEDLVTTPFRRPIFVPIEFVEGHMIVSDDEMADKRARNRAMVEKMRGK